ncbi:monocarboxylate transporter 9-like [Patiria miniata]|uniref:Major facilitator superfamily (MFS) profile domain-containing protein n=1 Tax=Patiria miniata TaxID=46514 RepID=A0A913ZY49_PATMI|nr:monocarboxylate transporter 9-like [Patiria miniata]XP_038056483.1 monocarboxylate transporter 9-like [Patiria miniata]XP_038056484.1 monocarboxylate transporter 9-like [Patiria miniata]XP_038056485.1 monocarboxylate transporter 9-like [Patiria miniata]
MVCLPQARCRWWRYVVPFLFFVQFFLCLGLLFNYSILFVSLQDEFQSGAALTGWLGSLSIALLCLLSPISNLLHPKLSRRAVALVGMTVYCAGLFLTSLVPALGYAFVTYGVLTGVGGNLVTSACVRMLLDWFATGNYSRAAAIGIMGPTCGMLSFSYLLTASITHYGWRGALRVFSGGILAVGTLTGLLFAEPPTAEDQNDSIIKGTSQDQKNGADNALAMQQIHNGGMEDSGEREVPAADPNSQDVHNGNKDDGEGDNTNVIEATEADDTNAPQKEPMHVDTANSYGLLAMIKDPEPWLWTIGKLLAYLGLSFFNINFASFLEGLHFDVNQIASSIAIYASGELGGKVLMAVVGDQLPFSYLYVLAGSCILSTVTLGLLSIAKTFTAIAVLAVVSGFLRAGVNATSLVVSTELFQQTYGPNGTLTLYLCPIGVGTLLGGLLSGILYDISGDYVLSLIVIAAIFLCGSVALLAIPLRRRIRSRGLCSHETHSIQG